MIRHANYLYLLAVGAALLLIGAGCSREPTADNSPSDVGSSPIMPTTTTYLVSKQNPLLFCNGEQMYSYGYRKTVVTEVVTSSVMLGDTLAEQAHTVAVLATSGQCQQALQQLPFSEENGTIHIPPIDAWAGISIALCSCRPQVEVNILRLPGVTNVKWDSI